MNFKNLSKKITAFALSAFTVLTLAGGVLQSVSANGGSGSGGSGGGQVTGDNPGYTVWFDQWGADGEPAQGWGEASMNNMQARIEGMLGKTMNPNAYGGTRPYLEIYQQAAREALADAQARSATGRARIVGVTSIYWDGGDNMQAAYDSKANVMRLAGTRPGTVDELPDNTGWSTTYNNGDGANGTNWRDWLEQYGVAKAADTNLTMIVWAVAEGEPTIPNIDLSVKKVSTLPDVVKGNECYAQDLSGAEYEVHRKADLSDTPLYTLVTDATGNVKAPEQIPFDSANPYLYVKETKAPKGYKLDPEVHVVSPYKKDSWLVTSYEEPMNDPVAIKLTKISEDLVENPASLEGAEFTVRFYAGQYTKETLPASATRTWVIKTLKKGDKYVTRLGEEYKVSGDEFYLDNDLPTLPLGTVTVEETKAPKGYTLKNKTLNANNEKIADGVALFNIVNDEGTNIPRLDGGNEYSIEEGVERGTFKFTKTDKATGETLVGGKFKIVNMNDYDVVLKNADGSVAETILAGAESTFEFSTDENGSFTGWDNMLQVGNYAIREVEAPVNYHIASNVEFTVNKDEVAPVAMKDEEKTPELKTVAVEDGTNSKLVAENQVRLKDTAEYQNVKPGEYNYTTTVIAKGETEADDVVVSKETKKVTLTEYSGTLEAFADIDTSELGGKELVFFEELDRIEKIEGHNYDVSHKDRNDEGQTVKVTKIRTEATDDVDGDHWLDGTKEVQNFTDKVMYRNLTPGKQYTTTATLMNYETGKPLLIDGKEVTKTVTFTPTEPDGTVLVPFEVSGIKLAGKKYVVFEDVYDENGIRVGMHHDLEDVGQTMKVTMKVGIKVVKIDSQNKERKLEGAEFTVFNKDGSVATDKSGKKLVATTDKNGEVKFSIDFDLDNIMYVQETKAPEGYKLNDTKYEIKPSEDYKVENDIVFTVENTLIPVEKTNDFGIALFAVAGIASLAGIAYILIKNKKRKA